MRKIALLTLQCTDNYGAMLQALALKTALDRYGHVSVLDYRPAPLASLLSDSPLRAGSPSATLGAALAFAPTRRKHAEFRRFMHERLGLQGAPLVCAEQLRQASECMDALVCGSDQIWNPHLTGWDPAYFLSFARDLPLRRVAYAASIGVDSPSVREAWFIRENATHLHHISVREECAKALLDKYVLHSVRVADPVWLTEKAGWEALAARHNKAPEGGYLFSYPMVKDELFFRTQQTVAAHLGLKAVTPFGGYRHAPRFDRMIFDASPEEFLGLLAGSACVVTNSFHGAALALLLGKRCFVTALGERNSRLETLTAAAGAPRLLLRESPGPHEMSALLDRHNPEEISRSIEGERERAWAFLDQAIGIPGKERESHVGK
jgi:hypothetical protein